MFGKKFSMLERVMKCHLNYTILDLNIAIEFYEFDYVDTFFHNTLHQVIGRIGTTYSDGPTQTSQGVTHP